MIGDIVAIRAVASGGALTSYGWPRILKLVLPFSRIVVLAVVASFFGPVCAGWCAPMPVESHDCCDEETPDVPMPGEEGGDCCVAGGVSLGPVVVVVAPQDDVLLPPLVHAVDVWVRDWPERAPDARAEPPPRELAPIVLRL